MASVGNDCTLLHQVTIGSNIGSQKTLLAAPKVGNRVFIGAGAKIIGDLEIGADAVIGANALVLDNVPADARVRAPKAQIFLKDTT